MTYEIPALLVVKISFSGRHINKYGNLRENSANKDGKISSDTKVIPSPRSFTSLQTEVHCQASMSCGSNSVSHSKRKCLYVTSTPLVMPVEINFSQIKQNINLITLSQKTVNRLRFSQRQELAHRKRKTAEAKPDTLFCFIHD